MRERGKKILKEFRGPGECQYCGRWCQHREAAHVYAKGMGAGSELNIPINLIALGGPWDCACHHKHHQGHEPTASDLRTMVAAREGTTQLAIEIEVARILRTPRP